MGRVHCGDVSSAWLPLARRRDATAWGGPRRPRLRGCALRSFTSEGRRGVRCGAVRVITGHYDGGDAYRGGRWRGHCGV